MSGHKHYFKPLHRIRRGGKFRQEARRIRFSKFSLFCKCGVAKVNIFEPNAMALFKEFDSGAGRRVMR